MTETDLRNQFQIIEDNLNDAYEGNDAERISELLGDDWVIVESSTGLSTKENFLNSIRQGNLKHSIMKKEVVDVKLYDAIVLVVTRGKNKGNYLGKPFDSEHWVTNIYKKNGSDWICIMTQEVAVTC